MTSEEFDDILNEQLNQVRKILSVKAEEYGPVDRLHNFKQAAHMLNVGLPQAVGGFMMKHTVSIYDMIQSGQPYDLDMWDEKITDHINYLILLRACLVENTRGPKGE